MATIRSSISAWGLMLVCFVSLFGGVAWAEMPDNTMETYSSWSVRCNQYDGLPPCDIVQAAVNNDTGVQVMRFSLAHAGEREEYGVRISVPLGVRLSGGALIRIDDQEEVTDLTFTRCDVSYCYIEARLAAEDIALFKEGADGILAVLDGQGDPLVLPISFQGFTAASNAMAARNRAWAEQREMQED